MISSVSISLYHTGSSSLVFVGDCYLLRTLPRPHPLPCIQLHPFFFLAFHASLSLVAPMKFLRVSGFYFFSESACIPGRAQLQESSSDHLLLPVKSCCIDLLKIRHTQTWRGSEALCIPTLLAMPRSNLRLYDTRYVQGYSGNIEVVPCFLVLHIFKT